MAIKDLFLKLTSTTTPMGHEQLMEPYLPKGWKKDSHGNYYYIIGDSKNNTVMFTCHLDTADSGQPKEIGHVEEGKIIKTDGKTILGGDDKAGAAIMIHMIQNKVNGLYCFFLGEERGCVGSGALKRYIEGHKEDELYKNLNKIISLDRRGFDSVITFQCGERCCSDEFADELAKQLNAAGGFKYVKDQGGLVTDSHQFVDLYPECTNLSVGYDEQHSIREKQDVEFLQKLADACCKIDWQNLPVKRDPTKIERRNYGYGRSYKYDDWEDGRWWQSGTKTNWNRSVSTGPGQLPPNTVYVNDYLGNRIKVVDSQWCEYDKTYCLKSEAIWVDYIGFWTCPDFDPSKVKKHEDIDNNGMVDVTEDVVKVGLILYTKSGNEEFGKVTEVADKVVVETDEGSRFMMPMNKFLTYEFKYKKEIESGTRKLTDKNMKEGLVVYHPIFGRGKIIGMRPDKLIVKVSFDNKGEKDFRVDVADMKF